MGLKSNTNKDSASDPKAKVAEIAHQRKLLDVIKQQEEEKSVLEKQIQDLLTENSQLRSQLRQ